jgi:hypothetical protein
VKYGLPRPSTAILIFDAIFTAGWINFQLIILCLNAPTDHIRKQEKSSIFLNHIEWLFQHDDFKQIGHLKIFCVI